MSGGAGGTSAAAGELPSSGRTFTTGSCGRTGLGLLAAALGAALGLGAGAGALGAAAGAFCCGGSGSAKLRALSSALPGCAAAAGG